MFPGRIPILLPCLRLELRAQLIEVRGDIETLRLDRCERLVHREEGCGEGLDTGRLELCGCGHACASSRDLQAYSVLADTIGLEERDKTMAMCEGGAGGVGISGRELGVYSTCDVGEHSFCQEDGLSSARKVGGRTKRSRARSTASSMGRFAFLTLAMTSPTSA